MPDIQITDIQIGDLVKYSDQRDKLAVEGAWLVIDMERNIWLDTESEGKYATLKKGSNTRYIHTSYLEKV